MNEKKSKSAKALICIPTYNEKENLTSIVQAVFSHVPEADILIIDDNSPDGTGQIADKLSKSDTRVNVLHRKEKQGLAKAYKSAFIWAKEQNYQYIVEFDADFSHNPSYLPQIIKELKNWDVVIGSRRVKGGGTKNWSLMRSIISSLGSLYANTILNISIRDLTGGFNGFSIKALKALDLKSIKSRGYAFQIEIKTQLFRRGFKILEIPIIFTDRKRGKSKMNISIFIEAILAVWRIRLDK